MRWIRLWTLKVLTQSLGGETAAIPVGQRGKYKPREVKTFAQQHTATTGRPSKALVTCRLSLEVKAGKRLESFGSGFGTWPCHFVAV